MRKQIWKVAVYAGTMMMAWMLLAGGLFTTAVSGNDDGDIVTNPWQEQFTDAIEELSDLTLEWEMTEQEQTSGTTAQQVTSAAEASTKEAQSATMAQGESDVTTVLTVGQTKVKKAVKAGAAAKKVKVTLKKVTGAQGYEIRIAKKKKFQTKSILVTKYVKKAKTVIVSKKIKGQKKLYVCARAVRKSSGKVVYGTWSAAKRVK